MTQLKKTAEILVQNVLGTDRYRIDDSDSDADVVVSRNDEWGDPIFASSDRGIFVYTDNFLHESEVVAALGFLVKRIGRFTVIN